MHIAYIHQYFVPPTGAGGTRSLEFARRFVAWGHKVTVITSDAFFPADEKVGSRVETRSVDGVELRVLGVPYANKFSYAKRIAAFGKFAAGALREMLRLRNVDVVFATSTPLTVVIPGLVAKLRHRVPMVFEVRDLWPEVPIAMGALRNPILRGIAKGMERVAYKSASEIVALSPGMRKGVLRGGGDPEHIHVIPNSSDVAIFRSPTGGAEPFLKQHPHLRGKRLVMYAGTLGAINGVGYLVRLAQAMRVLDPSVHVVILGSGREREEVRTLASDLRLGPEAISILDSIPKADIPHALSAATVLTSVVINLPETWANSANKFFDAFAAAKPIAINHEGWQADLLRNSGAGVVLPALDPVRGADELLAFMNNDEQMEAAQSASAHLADTQFDRDHLARRLLDVLERAVRGAS